MSATNESPRPADHPAPAPHHALAPPPDLQRTIEEAETQAQACLFVIHGLSHLLSEVLERPVDDALRGSLLSAALLIREQAAEAQRLHDRADGARRSLWRKEAGGRRVGGAVPRVAERRGGEDRSK